MGGWAVGEGHAFWKIALDTTGALAFLLLRSKKSS